MRFLPFVELLVALLYRLAALNDRPLLLEGTAVAPGWHLGLVAYTVLQVARVQVMRTGSEQWRG